MDTVHLHDVGAIDAIVDIIGTLICLDKLKIERIYVSAIPFNQGTLNYLHGNLLLPAPATVEILRNKKYTKKEADHGNNYIVIFFKH